MSTRCIPGRSRYDSAYTLDNHRCLPAHRGTTGGTQSTIADLLVDNHLQTLMELPLGLSQVRARATVSPVMVDDAVSSTRAERNRSSEPFPTTLASPPVHSIRQYCFVDLSRTPSTVSRTKGYRRSMCEETCGRTTMERSFRLDSLARSGQSNSSTRSHSNQSDVTVEHLLRVLLQPAVGGC